MNNYYIDRMKDIEKRYEGNFKRIINDLKSGAENAQRLRDDLVEDEINFFLTEANKEIKFIRDDYIKKCEKVLEEKMPIPQATKYTELDLRLMKLNMLARKDIENKDSLREILNEQDFNINKGQLIEIALLKGDEDLVKDISKITIKDEAYFKDIAEANFYKVKVDSNFIPGASVVEKFVVRDKGIQNYLNEIATKPIDMFNKKNVNTDNEIFK